MTKDEVRKAAEIMLAYAEGKEVEVRYGTKDWHKAECPNFDWFISQYRIKPSLKYRPFKNIKECWQEMQKHQPFGWVYTDENKAYRNILSVDFAKMPLVRIPDQGNFTLNDMFECYTFADGKPFGVKEDAE